MYKRQVEENLEYSDDGIEYSARLDLIVEDYTRGGMWVVEHKSARSITPELLAGYQLDQQVLGQLWLLEHCVDLSAYPSLRGVLVNITTKHKTGPKLERLEVSRSRKHLAAFESSMRSWYEVAQVLEDLDWPQALGSCAGPSRYFSRCDYYDLCFGHPDVSVEQLVREEPPLGFIRKTAE